MAVILTIGALPQTFTSGNWPITAMNSGRWRFTWTPTNASTDASWGGGFYCLFASSGTPSGTDQGGLWITSDNCEFYNQTGVVFSQPLTWGAGATITIDIDLVANTVTFSGASTGNGTFGFTDTGTYFTAGVLGAGIYGGGGFNLPASAFSNMDDGATTPTFVASQPTVPVRRLANLTALLAATGCVVPPVQPLAPPAPEMSWAPEYPDIVQRRPTRPHGALVAPPVDTSNPAPAPLFFAAVFPDRVDGARRSALGAIAAPPFQTTSPTPPPGMLEWLPRFPDRFPPRQMARLGTIVAPPFDTSSPPPAPFGFDASFPDMVPRRHRQVVGGAVFVPVATGGPLTVGVGGVRQRINALNPPTGTLSTYGTDLVGVTVDNTTDTITFVGHGMTVGDGPWRLITDGVQPGGTSPTTNYHINVTGANTFRLATTAANAVAGTIVPITSDGTGTITLVRVRNTDISGSTLLAFIARGVWSTSPNAPTDSKGNTYTATPGSPRPYNSFPSSQAGVYIKLSGVGGPAHQWSATWGDLGGSGDEITVGGLEVHGAPILKSTSIVERAVGSATITSGTVVATAPAILIAVLFGNGPVGQDHTWTFLDGFAKVPEASAEGDISGNGYIQLAVAWKKVASGGTYSFRAQGVNNEGAQMVLLALQALEDEAPPMDWYVEPADIVRRVRRPASSVVQPLVVPAPALPILSWQPEADVMPRARAWRPLAGAVGPLVDFNAGPQPELTVFVDQVPRRSQRPVGGAVAPPSDTNAGPLTWSPAFPDRIVRASRAVEGVVVAPLRVDTIVTSWWTPNYPDLLRRMRSTPDSAQVQPLFFEPPAPPPPWSDAVFVDRVDERRPIGIGPAFGLMGVEPIPQPPPPPWSGPVFPDIVYGRQRLNVGPAREVAPVLPIPGPIPPPPDVLPPLPITVNIQRPMPAPRERTKYPNPRIITPELDGDLKLNPRPECSLVESMASTIDEARQMASDFGLRYYQVFSVVVRWSGGERKRGTPTVISERPFLPVPKVEGIERVDRELRAGGAVKRGEIRLTKLSPRYTADDILLLFPRELRDDEEHYIEVRGDSRDGMPHRQRYVITGMPERGITGWSVRLDKADENRTREGRPR